MCSYAKWKVPTRSQRSFHILDRDLWPLCEFCCKNQSPFQILWISLSHFVLTHNKVFSDGCRIIYSASWSTHKRCPCPLSHDLLPCSLLLSPLCDVCPPLDGPGVPPERVDAVSSWSLFQDVWEKERQNRKVNQLIEYSTFTDLSVIVIFNQISLSSFESSGLHVMSITSKRASQTQMKSISANSQPSHPVCVRPCNSLME